MIIIHNLLLLSVSSIRHQQTLVQGSALRVPQYLFSLPFHISPSSTRILLRVPSRVGCSINPLKKYNQFKINFTRLCWDTFSLQPTISGWTSFLEQLSIPPMALSWWQYFIFLSPSLSLLLLFTRLEPPSGIALEGGIKRRYIFYILDFYLFRGWSDDSRRFDSGYWFSWKHKIFDNCSRFVLINDFAEKCWFWCFGFVAEEIFVATLRFLKFDFMMKIWYY